MEKAFNNSSSHIWYIAVPSSGGFTEPQFHFGERVRWSLEEQGNLYQLTGRIVGIWFYNNCWNYDINLDLAHIEEIELEECVTLQDVDLSLVCDECALRDQLDPLCEWLPTQRAAKRLGLLPEQLRHLRQQGKFMQGYHCRDASVPGSRKPLWQWHIGRCNEALATRTQ
ncbi:hypothetical protein H6F88_01150 [Oculatella sp. FACHB-28]|uniref:hypothetical protein n=1 Tax=Oculatella sp. FACHB-28 TaxID=2692845 RepID=UPI001682F486|nr:hypothetical protein [Oculatella sp. FACHB-28]MBD2054648.1 hypothetical protein [Oculatella sp. FACHB-28]